jgi:hypothetical protein
MLQRSATERKNHLGIVFSNMGYFLYVLSTVGRQQADSITKMDDLEGVLILNSITMLSASVSRPLCCLLLIECRVM